TAVAGGAAADPNLAPPVDPFVDEDDEDLTAPTRRSEPAPWKGTAGVRPPDGHKPFWDEPRDEPERRAWWLPVVIGIIGLIILIGAAFALVVAMKGPNTPVPAPSATSVASPIAQTPSAQPSLPPSGPPTPSTAPSS